MIKPIHYNADYMRSLKRIDKLWGAKRGTKHGDEFEVLIALVEVYEAEHYPIPPPTPIEAIKFYMDQKNMSQTDLSKMLGSRSRVSEILSGKRNLTVKMMKIRHHELGVPAESLLR